MANHEQQQQQKKAFKTDTSISNAQMKERKLEKWHQGQDDVDGKSKLESFPSSSTNSSLCSSLVADSKSANWDQFETNEKLFGVKTTFDENLYTIKIDKSSKEYLLIEKKAEKLANDMLTRQKSPALGRFRDVDEINDDDDDDEDEETKFSSVIRPPAEQIPKAPNSKLNFQAKEFVPSFDSSSSCSINDDDDSTTAEGEQSTEFSSKEETFLYPSVQQIPPPYYNPYFYPYGTVYFAPPPPSSNA